MPYRHLFSFYWYNKNMEERFSTREKSPIEIEIANKGDLENYKSILKEALREHVDSFGRKLEDVEKRSEKEWTDDLENPEEPVFLAKSGPNPVGMVGIFESDEKHKFWNIISLYAKKDFADQFVGKKLVKRAEEEIINRGGKRAVLYFRGTKKDLQSYYERLGFKLIPGATHKEIWERMEKDLSA